MHAWNAWILNPNDYYYRATQLAQLSLNITVAFKVWSSTATYLLTLLTFTYFAYLFAYLINFLTLLTYFLSYSLTLYLVTYVTYFTYLLYLLIYLLNFLILLTYLLTYLLDGWRTWLGDIRQRGVDHVRDVRQRGVGRHSGQFHADVVLICTLELWWYVRKSHTFIVYALL